MKPWRSPKSRLRNPGGVRSVGCFCQRGHYAKAIAKRFGSHILLVHVGQPVNPITIPKGESFWDEAIREEQEIAAAGMVLREEGFSAEALNIPISIRDQIQALAKVYESDRPRQKLFTNRK
jgi:hypothetical protein